MLAAIRRARMKHGKNYDTEQLPGRLVQAEVTLCARLVGDHFLSLCHMMAAGAAIIYRVLGPIRQGKRS
jgi:hypothetical protein